MTGFPDPPKPPLPPPPLPPWSSLMGDEHRLGKLTSNTEREQFAYSRFLQNFIFKYNNRNMHKLCTKIDLNHLEYLMMPHQKQQSSDSNKILSSSWLDRNRILSTSSATSNSESWLTSRATLGGISLSTTTTSRMNRIFLTSFTNLSVSSVTLSPPHHHNNVTSSLSLPPTQKQFEIEGLLDRDGMKNSTNLLPDSGLFDFDDYVRSLVGRFNVNPWNFFYDNLLVPTIILFVFFIAVISGLIVKSCVNKARKYSTSTTTSSPSSSSSSSGSSSTSSASSSSFIACYGTTDSTTLGSTSVENSIGVHSSTLILTSNAAASSLSSPRPRPPPLPLPLVAGKNICNHNFHQYEQQQQQQQQQRKQNKIYECNHIYYSDESSNMHLPLSSIKKIGENPYSTMNKILNPVNNEKIAVGNINIDYEEDDDDEDQSSSGKYYSIKSNNNFCIENTNKTRAGDYALTTCLSTFGRHKQPNSNGKSEQSKSKTDYLILNINQLRNGCEIRTKPAEQPSTTHSSLTNSSSHSVESATAVPAAAASIDHYNEPTLATGDVVYFTSAAAAAAASSSYSKLIMDVDDIHSNNRLASYRFYTAAGLEKTSSSKVFPRTNPLYRNHGGSTLRLNQTSTSMETSKEEELETTIKSNLNKRTDIIDVCSKL